MAEFMVNCCHSHRYRENQKSMKFECQFHDPFEDLMPTKNPQQTSV